MKKMFLRDFPGWMIILLFTYASSSKIIAFSRFVQQINNQPLPATWKPLLPYGVLAIEICAILLLTIPKTRLSGLVLSAFIMLGFTIYVSIIVLHGFAYVPCSCGGVIEHLSWTQHLILNLFYLLLALLGIRHTFHRTHTRPT